MEKWKKMMPTDSSEGSKLLCFSVCWNRFGEESMWYKAHVEKKEEEVGKKGCVVEAKAESIISGPPSSPAYFVSYAAIGSTIYALGGVGRRRVECDDVYSYSTTSTQRGNWSKLPSMLVGRSRPLTAVLDNKLYVFGGLNMSSPEPEPWAEFFDPYSEKWWALPALDLLCASARSAVSAVVSHAHKIILLLNPRNRMLYLYSAQVNSWKLFDEVPEDVHFPCDQPVMVDDTMYYFSGQHLYAYDIYRRDWLSTKIVGLDMDLDYEEEHVIPSKSLIHLGGDTFYLVWLHEHSVRCTRFRASVDIRSDDGKVNLIASVESEKSYLIVGNNDEDLELLTYPTKKNEDLEFGGALLLDPGWRSDEGTSEIIPTPY